MSNELKERINNHPILDVDPPERKNDPSYLKFFHLLLQYYRFDKKLQVSDRISEDQITDTEKHERGLEKAIYKSETGKKIRPEFDSVAFWESYTYALQYYQKGKSAFLTFFIRIYLQRFHREANLQVGIRNQKGGTRLTKEEIRIVKSLNSILEKEGKEIGNVPYSDLEVYAGAVGVSADKLQKLRDFMLRVQSVKSLDSAISRENDGDEDLSYMDVLSSAETQDAFDVIENIQLFKQVIRLITDNEMRDYPRLFWNNILMAPMKNEDAADPDGVKEALIKVEEELFSGLLDNDYLVFVLITPPEPDKIENIYMCKMRHQFIDKTIAAYKNVTPQMISKEKRKFIKLQSDIRQAMEQLI